MAPRSSRRAATTKDTPKRRGRPARATIEDEDAAAPVPAPVADEAPAPKRRGRKPAEPAPEPAADPVPAPALKKRAGRPRKQDPAADAPSTPKRRGRPSASALDLKPVAGPARVSKRAASTRTSAPAVATRSSPRTSRQTNKAPPVAAAPKPKAVLKATKSTPKEPPAQKKRVGRPPKNPTATPANKTPTKSAEHKTKDARVAKPTSKPRKKRGYTTVDVPDRFAEAVIGYLQQLMDTEAAPDEQPTKETVTEDDHVGMADAEDAEAAPTHGDNGDIDAEDDASAQLEHGDESILVIEELVEAVVGDDTEPQELDRALEDDAIKHRDMYDDDGDLEPEYDALQVAHGAVSDTGLDEEESVIDIEEVEEIETQLEGREYPTQEAPGALDLQQEISEITESTPQADSEHAFNSLFAERPQAISQVDDLEAPSDSDDDEDASFSAPAPLPTSFRVAPPANMPSAVPYSLGAV